MDKLVFRLKFSLYVLSAVTAALAVSLWATKRDLHDAEDRLSRAFEHHRQLVGSTRFWKGSNGEMITYNLRSFDDGRTWAAVEYDNDWRMRIKGDAEQLYPGLVKTVQGTQELMDRASSGRPLDLSAAKDREMQANSGIDVQSK